MTKILKLSLILPTVLALTAMPFYPTLASQDLLLNQGPQSIVCNTLASVGFGCDPQATPTPNTVGGYEPQPVRLNFDIFNNSPSGDASGSTSSFSNTNIVKNAKAPKDLSGQKINLVSVPNSGEIYSLVNGQKHVFPSFAIFYDYGYTIDMVQSIYQYQLDKYPRAHLIKVKGSSNIYYLTEGGLVRPVVDKKKIFEFYGDRAEDVITISRKEFNFYPTNKYVYQFSPLNRDVFQISGSGKRYLTPMAVARLGIQPDQVAPVSKAELDLYKTLAPLID